MSEGHRHVIIVSSCYLSVLVALWLVRNNPFFWDTIQLSSKHAHFFYETDFQSIILPEVMDSGHPPAFGMYLAAMWKVFGKSLPVSHSSMLPFLWGIVFFLLKIGNKLVNNAQAPWLVLLCFVDPALAGQSVLISPDIALVCFFLMGFWAIEERKSVWLTIAIAGLGVTSMRGMMVGTALYLYGLLTREKITIKSVLSTMLPFLPGGLLAVGYLFHHWQQTGWIGYHAGSTWAPSFEKVDMQGFIKNLAVLTWRLLDVGRVFVWLVLAVVISKRIHYSSVKASVSYWKNKSGNFSISGLSPAGRLILLAVLVFLCTAPTQLLYKGLLAHRYLLPVFLCINLLVYNKIFGCEGRSGSRLQMWWLRVVLLAGLATGNCWIYPKTISQGWDSTLAHLPWYDLSKNAEEFLLKENIPFSHVGTAFPNIGPRENMNLNGLKDGFVEKDLQKNCYIYYSNIMNDFEDEQINRLEREWKPMFSLEKRGISIVIYKNPNNETCEN